MENSGDRFASVLIPNCQRTASQDAKQQSLPFAFNSKSLPDYIQPSSSTDDAAEEQAAGIEMLTLPDSFDEYQTPPEQPSYSQNSSNDGPNAARVNEIDDGESLANESDNLDTEQVDLDDQVDVAIETEIISSTEDIAHQVFVKMPQREEETSNRENRKFAVSVKRQKRNNKYSNYETFKNCLKRVDLDNQGNEIDAGKSVTEAIETVVISSPEDNAHQVFAEMPQREEEIKHREKRQLPVSVKRQNQNRNYPNRVSFRNCLKRVSEMAMEGESRDCGDELESDFLEIAKMRGLSLPRPRWWPAAGFKA